MARVPGRGFFFDWWTDGKDPDDPARVRCAGCRTEAAEDGGPAGDHPDIAEAREHGDLSENAEYHAAREKQGFIEGRIKELEGTLSLAEVIDPAKLSGAIKFGATVQIVDEDSDEEKTYQIVGEVEANIENRPSEHPLAAGPRPDRQGGRRQRRCRHPRRAAQLRNPVDPLSLTMGDKPGPKDLPDLGLAAEADPGRSARSTEMVAGLMSVVWVVAVLAYVWPRRPATTCRRWAW
jgi:hypothetical protein